MLDSSDAVKFHSMLYFPSGTALHFPGYVVALEKSPQKIIGGPKFNDNARFVHSEAAYFKGEEDTRYDTAHHIEQFQTFDSKTMFVSHILQNGVLQDDSVEGTPIWPKLTALFTTSMQPMPWQGKKSVHFSTSIHA